MSPFARFLWIAVLFAESIAAVLLAVSMGVL